MKKLLGLFLLGLVMAWGVAGVAVGQSSQTEAQTLTQRGFQYLDRGQSSSALEQWQAAESAYRRLASVEGVVGSQVNQSLALQQLGLYPRACKTLVQALALGSPLCQVGAEPLDEDGALAQRVTAIASTGAHRSGLNSLGVVLTALGKPEVALQVLTATLPQVEPAQRPDLALSIANAYSHLALQRLEQYEATDDPTSRAKFLNSIQKLTEAALLAYDQAQAGSERVRVQSQVNALQLLSELHHWEPESIFTQPLRVRVQSALDRRLPQAASLQVSALPAIEAVYAQLGLARSLERLDQPQPAQQFAKQALKLAEGLGNLRAQSFAWGALAQHSPGSALPSSQKALSLAQSSQSWDVSYRWERALGQLAQQQGQRPQAADYYRAAVQDLDLVRGNLLAIDSRAQFSLEDQVEPVYREYLQILFSSPTPDLGQAIADQHNYRNPRLRSQSDGLVQFNAPEVEGKRG